MQLVQKITGALIAFALVSATSEVLAQASPAPVDFEQLGAQLDLKKLGTKEKSILQKLDITEAANGSFGPKPRIVGIDGGSGFFVITQFCDANARGDQESCEIQNIVSLNTGKLFSTPQGEPIVTMFNDQKSSTQTRYMTNNKGELVSLIYVGNYVKAFKGKTTCNNLGAIIDADGKSMKLSGRVSKKPLGSECLNLPNIPEKDQGTKQAMDRVDSLRNAFFNKLVAKALMN